MKEKYGVFQPDEKVKTASGKEGCPSCGGKVANHSGVLICANCGSKPFERNTNGKSQEDRREDQREY